MSDTQPTEVVKELPKEQTPFKNTTTGKTLRTLFQSAAGVLLVFALSDEFRTFIQDRFPTLVVFMPLAVALMTAVQNALDKNTPLR